MVLFFAIALDFRDHSLQGSNFDYRVRVPSRCGTEREREPARPKQPVGVKSEQCHAILRFFPGLGWRFVEHGSAMVPGLAGLDQYRLIE